MQVVPWSTVISSGRDHEGVLKLSRLHAVVSLFNSHPLSAGSFVGCSLVVRSKDNTFSVIVRDQDRLALTCDFSVLQTYFRLDFKSRLIIASECLRNQLIAPNTCQPSRGNQSLHVLFGVPLSSSLASRIRANCRSLRADMCQDGGVVDAACPPVANTVKWKSEECMRRFEAKVYSH